MVKVGLSKFRKSAPPVVKAVPTVGKGGKAIQALMLGKGNKVLPPATVPVVPVQRRFGEPLAAPVRVHPSALAAVATLAKVTPPVVSMEVVEAARLALVKLTLDREPLDPRLDALCQEAESKALEVIETINRRDYRDPIPQSVLLRIKSLDILRDRLNKILSKAEPFIFAAYAAKVPFESGEVKVLVESAPGKNSTPWKEEAVALARKLATVNAEGFDADIYVQSVQARYPAKSKIEYSLVLKG